MKTDIAEIAYGSHLLEPRVSDKNPSWTPTYQVTLRWSVDDPTWIALRDQIEAMREAKVAQEKVEEGTYLKPSWWKHPKNRDTKEPDKSLAETTFSMPAWKTDSHSQEKIPNQIVCFDSTGAVIELDQELGHGSKVRVEFECYCMYREGNFKVVRRLQAIQVIEHVEGGAGHEYVVEGFGAVTQ